MAPIPDIRSQPATQMAMNTLLHWMSARRSGSMNSFGSKVTELGLIRGRLTHRIVQWNLEKLGHAEFGPAAAGKGWRVAPPILAAGDPWQSPSAFLCGARTPELLERLRSADVQEHRQSQCQGPEIVKVVAPSPWALQECAASAGIEVQWNAPLAILSCFTPPTEQSLAPTSIPIGGWDVTRFSKTGLTWVPSSVDQALAAAAGLFRFRSSYEIQHVLIEDGLPQSVEPATGKYRILKKRHSPLSYSMPSKALKIRSSCRPPSLVERALVLCSGALPVFKDGLITYSSIEPTMAFSVASRLGQRLR